ncbi:MAG: hypothetical protein CVT78_02945 [Alphaproteobacteria bacterium HGW-Alphaproteobacteria-17]|nr:MAG: hypothetical protein CVT78_02945 [Alphaproteobacteria bacterium HGW-Alphaproteobacteria-17]
MVRKTFAGVILAGSLLTACLAWAQQKAPTSVTLNQTPFDVSFWRTEQSPEAGNILLEVSTPASSRTRATVRIGLWADGSTGSWSVRWRRNVDRRHCIDEVNWVKALAEQAGFQVRSLSIQECESYRADEGVLASNGTLTLERRAKGSAPGGKCSADAFVGTWQRPGFGRQNAQVRLVLAIDGDTGSARARGFARHPYSEDDTVITRITGDGSNCRFQAKCGKTLESAPSCTVVVDPAKNTLKVEGGTSIFISNLVWTRAAAPPEKPTCTRQDIEGDWHRSDGSLVPIVGVDAFARGPGGNALLFNHPENWPRGQTKFRGIYRVGGAQSCQLKAVCAGYDRNSRTGAVTRNERACELTIDPVRGTLRESGSNLTYRRDGRGGAPTPAPAPVPEPKVSAEELAATRSLNADQAATAKREIERYEADKKRIADEQAANEAAYRKALADREALIAENDRKAREAMRKWEADVAACKAGDRSKCAPGPN